MINRHCALRNDRTLIETFDNEMGGGTNNFQTASVGLLIGIFANECGQERMMNVDYSLWKLQDEIAAEYSHIPREHEVIRR